MSQIDRNVFIPIIACLVALFVNACSSGGGGGGGSEGVINPEGEGGVHPAGWLNRNSDNFHANAYLQNVGACTECHGPALQGGIAQVGCYAANRGGVSCHPGNDAPHMTPLLAPNGTALEVNSILMCGKCHDLNNFQSDRKNQCQRCHADPDDPSDPLNGQLKKDYPQAFPFGFGSAQNVKNHSAAVVGTKYGPWESDCIKCHNPHAQEQDNTFGTNYGKLIKRSLSYFNNVTSETVEGLITFTAPTGPGSFADGPPHDENICEVCHTRTNHHQRDGTAPGGQEHFSGQNCTQCHPHGGGFAFSFGGEGLALPPPHDTEPFLNNCDYCHVDDGAGNIDFRAVIPDSKCSQCHSADGALKAGFSTAPNVMGHSGKTCVECHNPMFEQTNLALVRSTIASSVFPESNIVFTARSGPGSFADGPPHEENICETCHSATLFHQADGTAPGGQSHNDGTVCTSCHAHGNGFEPDRTPPPPPHDQFDCGACHVTGDTYRLDADIPNSACESCHAAGTPDGSQGGSDIKLQSHHGDKIVDPDTEQPITLNCVECHNPMREKINFRGNRNLAFVRAMIRGNNIAFESRTGPYSFADSSGSATDMNTENYVCNTCHTNTNHHQNDGTAPGGQEHFSGQNCTQCHTHGGGFVFASGDGGSALPPPHDTAPFLNNCDYCHVDDGAGNVDFSTVVPDTKCNQCHSANGTLKADFSSAPNVLGHIGKPCVECHNPMWEQTNLAFIRSTIASSVIPDSNITFTARSGPGSFADGPPHEENICETCHSATLFHQADGTAPGGQSHNDGSNCIDCHAHSNAFSADRTPPPAPHSNFSCEVCHVNGDTYQLNAVIPNTACESCHGLGTPGSAQGGSNVKVQSHYGDKIVDPDSGQPITLSCVECHNPMREQVNFRGNPNLAFVRVAIRGNNIAYESKTGPYSFANDSGRPADMETENYVCNTCHTNTNHHQKDGTAPLGQSHFDGQDCTGCHTHDGAFAPPFALQEGDSPSHLTTLLNRDGSENPESSDLVCGKCHDSNDFQNETKSQCQRCHADSNDPSDPLNGTSKDAYPDVPPYGYGSSPNVMTHASSVVGDKYGEWHVDCEVCHNPHSQDQNNSFGTSYGKLINRVLTYSNQATGETIESVIEFTAPTGAGSFADGAPYSENICNTCHTRTEHHQNDGTAPNGQFHFDTGNCTDCHLHSAGFAKPFLGEGGPNPPHVTDLLNPDGTVHPDSEILLCGKCHDLDDFQSDVKYQCQRCHADSSDPSDPLNGTLKDQYPETYPFGFGSATNVVTHGSDTLGTNYGEWGAVCVTCHNPHTQEQNNTFGTDYGKLIKRTISFENQATGGAIENSVEFIAPTGSGSFADGPPHDENICETCHTRTIHHRNDGTAPEQSHFDGEKCTNCHRHIDGFSPAAGKAQPPHGTAFFTANCQYCHVVDANGNAQFAIRIPSEECTKCHSTRQTHASSVSGTGKYTYAIECVDCHNPMFAEGDNIKSVRRDIPQSLVPGAMVTYTAKQGPGSFADGPPHGENICETCHSQTAFHRFDGSTAAHFDGEKCTNCHNHDNSWLP